MNDTEPESVCPCPGTYPSFLNMGTGKFVLNSIPTSTSNFGSSGINIDFTIYAYNVTSYVTKNTILFSLLNYADILLVDNLTTL